MDVPITMTSTQIVLVCTLLGLLLAWMVTFAWLALRPTPEKKARREEFAVRSTSSQPLPVTPAPSRLRMIVSVPAQTAAMKHGQDGGAALEQSIR